MSDQMWLLFSSQLPASPSSPRVKVWRRMRAAGAIGLQNGVWILPNSPELATQVQELLVFVQEQGGSGQVFVVNALTQDVEADIRSQFEKERCEEYEEFLEHCREFLEELERETRAGKFTYGELEESEANFDRLQKWLPKIQARDFMGQALAGKAIAELQSCQQKLEAFTEAVYQHDDNAPGS